MLKLKQIRTMGYQYLLPCLTGWGLSSVLGLAGGIWLMTGAIAPQIAQADPTRLVVSLTQQPGESYQTLIQRAQGVARDTAQRNFDSNAQANDVMITVMGETRGQIVPLLTLSTNRELWRGIPVPRGSIVYYQTARGLLQLDPSSTTGTVQSSPTPDSTAAGTPATSASGDVTQPPTGATQTSSTTNTNNTNSPTSTDSGTMDVPERPPVIINIPATPSGQIGLPRSILR